MELAPPSPSDSLACLSDLTAASEELSRRAQQLAALAAASREGARLGVSLDRRLILVEQIAAAIRMLARDGNRFRRMEARALYAEGLTMAQLASVFGVSRQRVSALLRDGWDGAEIDGAVQDGVPDGRGPAASARGGAG